MITEDELRGALAEDMAEIRRRMEELAEDCTDLPPLQEAAALLRHPGKGLRPLLTLLGARLEGDPPSERILVALALELLHMGSLVHDDVLDESEERRGRPSAHARWGERVAHLAGDWFLTHAWTALCTGLPSTASAMVLLRELAATGEALFQGQVLEWRVAQGPVDLPSWEAVARGKTGSLMAFAARSGALLIEAPAAQVAALARYGEALGLAFQLSDDLEDRALASRDGPPSRPSFPGLDGPEGLEEARRRARIYERTALEALAAIPEGAIRSSLGDLARFAADRSHPNLLNDLRSASGGW